MYGFYERDTPAPLGRYSWRASMTDLLMTEQSGLGEGKILTIAIAIAEI
jgi:hypothetical protein